MIARGKLIKDYEIAVNIRDEEKILLLNGEILKDNFGLNIGMVLAINDITARKITEDNLRNYAEELEKTNLISTDRELQMVEIKKEINILLAELGRLPKY